MGAATWIAAALVSWLTISLPVIDARIGMSSSFSSFSLFSISISVFFFTFSFLYFFSYFFVFVFCFFRFIFLLLFLKDLYAIFKEQPRAWWKRRHRTRSISYPHYFVYLLSTVLIVSNIWSLLQDKQKFSVLTVNLKYDTRFNGSTE